VPIPLIFGCGIFNGATVEKLPLPKFKMAANVYEVVANILKVTSQLRAMPAVSQTSLAWSQMLGTRWNRVAGSFRSIVISISGSVAAILNFGVGNVV